MNRLPLVLVVVAAAAVPCLASAQTAMQILAAGCADDAKQFCSNVPSGGGRIIACLRQHKDSLSDKCKQAAAQAAQATPAAPAAQAAPVTPAEPAAPAAMPPAAAAEPPKHVGHGRPGSYLVMKKVQVTGPGPDAAHPTVPAYELMIPSTWKVQGGVRFGGSPSGCFSDIFALNLQATSPDGSSVFAAAPDYSWQYSDDPSVLKSLNDPSRRALGVGGKPCPVARPLRAEEYLRENILKLYPSGTQVLSVAPFPELNEIVRRRQGLPPGNGTGSTHTEATRMRLAWQKDGKEQEGWVAVGIVVDVYPAGHGSLYDIHATALTAMSVPKGQLDSNDRLFEVMTGSIHPLPEWVRYSGGVIARLNQAQAQKLATINRLWSDFYAKEAQTINGVTANAMRGADASVFHEDQNIRGVQTFVDPATGRTQELSNLYDHAWQNGSDEYIMSNDPSFNPNEHLNGNWSELRPAN